MAVRQWLDTHIHVSNFASDGKARNDILDDLVAVLDTSGADLRLVLSGDFPWPTRMTQDPAMVMEGNRFIHDLARRAPGRLYGACTVNPHFLEESRRAMAVCFEEWGFVILGEMLQYIMRYQMNSEAVVQLARMAARYHVPVQVHISTSNSGPQGQFQGGGTEEMEDFLALAERVPEASYILAHLVGTAKDDPPVVAGYLDQIDARFGRFPGNFWVEIRDFNSPGVGTALERVPRNRLIAGTDWTTREGPPFLPYGTVFAVKTAAQNPYPPGVESMTRFLELAGAGATDIADIACGNAMRLLRLCG